LPEYEKYKALFNAPVAKVDSIEMSAYPEKLPEYVKRLTVMRDELPMGRLLS
jgi:hypothetical protein